MLNFRHPAGFANWAMLIGFITSWIVWKLVIQPLLEVGILAISDGFIIISIYTVTSWIRVYLLNKFQQHLWRKEK